MEILNVIKSKFSSFYCFLFQNVNRKSMFAILHSDINSLKSGLLYLTGKPHCKKGVDQQKSKMEL